MVEVARYLKENYYPHYPKAKDNVPTEYELVMALQIHASKVITIYKGEKIAGVGIYLTLDDRTFEHIRDFDMDRVDVLARLLVQTGKNFHFILLTADSMKTIRIGLKVAMALGPKTISWWNPTNTYLHTRILK